MILLFQSLAFAKTTEVDFDEVEITANRETPSISLIRDTVRSLCPNEDNTSLAWQECAVNLSYEQISTVCSSLGEKTPKIVNDLITTSEATEVYQNHSDGQTLHWQGCLYNSKTGPRVENFVWIYAKNNWVMTDGESKVYAVDKKSSITVFDGTETSSDVTVIGGGFDVPGTFAYLLVPSDVKDGVYTGVVAKNNQREINKIISSSNLIPRYCDGLENWKGCEQLPNMIVTSVTPWMMIVKTLMPDKVGYQVSGIFFQSITGYDYTDGG